MATPAADRPKRETYRHGDLRRALIEAGVELARAGGPDAIVLRAATRQVGVAPNAAYRHFADARALQRAVCGAAQAELARAMESQLGTLPEDAAGPLADPTGGTAEDAKEDPARVARIRLRALGEAYLDFALAEPGLFRTAFAVPDDMSGSTSPQLAGDTGYGAFQLVAAALDGMVTAGVLSVERRPGAEFVAWAAVHGLAVLLIDGPLRGVDRPQLEDIGERVLDMLEHGL